MLFSSVKCYLYPIQATKIMIKKIARDKHPRVVIISLKVVSFTSFLDLPKKIVNFVNLVCDNSFPSIKSPSFLLNLFPFPDKTLSRLSKITLATTTKTKQNPKSTRLYILGHLFLYIYLQSFFSLFFRGCRGVCYLGACWTLKKKFVDFVKVRVLELCTLSRAPPFFSVHFFL